VLYCVFLGRINTVSQSVSQSAVQFVFSYTSIVSSYLIFHYILSPDRDRDQNYGLETEPERVVWTPMLRPRLIRYRPGDGETISPRRRWQFDGGKNRGGSTSVRGRVRSPQSAHLW